MSSRPRGLKVEWVPESTELKVGFSPSCQGREREVLGMLTQLQHLIQVHGIKVASGIVPAPASFDAKKELG